MGGEGREGEEGGEGGEGGKGREGVGENAKGRASMVQHRKEV